MSEKMEKFEKALEEARKIYETVEEEEEFYQYIETKYNEIYDNILNGESHPEDSLIIKYYSDVINDHKKDLDRKKKEKELSMTKNSNNHINVRNNSISKNTSLSAKRKSKFKSFLDFLKGNKDRTDDEHDCSNCDEIDCILNEKNGSRNVIEADGKSFEIPNKVKDVIRNIISSENEVPENGIIIGRVFRVNEDGEIQEVGEKEISLDALDLDEENNDKE